ncbi:MAG TPA: asparaginase, partial [Longimicrobiales bacterium]|nr:asparaginase [Longimicrobiales bacterium]
EGVHGAGLRDRAWGVALKVGDGGRRAADAALVAVLEALGVVGADEVEALKRFGRPEVRNTRGEVVGEVVPRIDLPAPGRGA